MSLRKQGADGFYGLFDKLQDNFFIEKAVAFQWDMFYIFRNEMLRGVVSLSMSLRKQGADGFYGLFDKLQDNFFIEKAVAFQLDMFYIFRNEMLRRVVSNYHPLQEDFMSRLNSHRLLAVLVIVFHWMGTGRCTSFHA